MLDPRPSHTKKFKHYINVAALSLVGIVRHVPGSGYFSEAAL